MELTRYVKTGILLVALVSNAVLATPLEKIRIPGAVCGNGGAYDVYVKHRDPDKVLVVLEGGGACWNEATCFGPVPYTHLYNMKKPEKRDVFLMSDTQNHSFRDWTVVYVPYCTGDFFVGSHDAHYGKHVVHHAGRTNVTQVISAMESSSQIFSRARDFTLYGESAGALGVLTNADQFERVVNPEANKNLVIDSPGLHFSKSVWRRFSKTYLADVKDSLGKNNIDVDFSTGILAPLMHNYCAKYKTWKTGFLQATEDWVMSMAFGNVTQQVHRARVLGPQGLFQQLEDENDNCSAWIHDGMRHIYGNSQSGWDTRVNDGTTFGDFVTDLVNLRAGEAQRSHR